MNDTTSISLFLAPDGGEGGCGDHGDEFGGVDETADDAGTLAVEGAAGDVLTEVVDTRSTSSEARVGGRSETGTKTEHINQMKFIYGIF